MDEAILNAVLEIGARVRPELSTKQSFEWHQGYNAFRAEVHRIAQEKMGVGG